MIVQIAVIGTFALLGFGIVVMIFSGIRGLSQGKQDLKRIGIMAIPFVLFGISYVVFKDAELALVKAGSMTTLIMLAIMAIMVVFTGIRSTLKS